MNAVHALWKDGRIILARPVDWPDGTPLSVEPIGAPRDDEPDVDLLGNDPDSIARWIAEYNALPPLQMTEGEEAEWRAAQRAMRDYSIAAMSKRSIEGRP